jgi:two-component system chemotaxis response regulator CheB
VPLTPIVAIGGSAGALEATRAMCGALPFDFPAPILVVLHTAAHSPGVVGDILDRAGPLRAANATDHERICRGRIYVAPPDFHLLVEPGLLRLAKGPKENRFRPAIDPLFRSVAQVYGPRATGVLLSGHLDDGTAGLWTIKQLGGHTIVQDPREAEYVSMPESAIRHVRPDEVLSTSEIPAALIERTAAAFAPEPQAAVPGLDVEVQIAKEHSPMKAGIFDLGTPSTIACPECHGVLLRIKEGDRDRFRCHTGHAYSLDSLLADMRERAEDAQWSAVRAMQERVMLLRHAATHLAHDAGAAAALLTQADTEQRRADSLRRIIQPDRESEVPR